MSASTLKNEWRLGYCNSPPHGRFLALQAEYKGRVFWVDLFLASQFRSPGQLENLLNEEFRLQKQQVDQAS